MNLCGTPRDDLLETIISQSARNFIKTLPIIPKKDFIDVFVGANPKAVDLLEKVHDPEDEPSAPLYDKSYEDSELTIEQWKKLAFEAIVNFTFPPDLIADY